MAETASLVVILGGVVVAGAVLVLSDRGLRRAGFFEDPKPEDEREYSPEQSQPAEPDEDPWVGDDRKYSPEQTQPAEPEAESENEETADTDGVSDTIDVKEATGRFLLMEIVVGLLGLFFITAALEAGSAIVAVFIGLAISVILTYVLFSIVDDMIPD